MIEEVDGTTDRIDGDIIEFGEKVVTTELYNSELWLHENQVFLSEDFCIARREQDFSAKQVMAGTRICRNVS